MLIKKKIVIIFVISDERLNMSHPIRVEHIQFSILNIKVQIFFDKNFLKIGYFQYLYLVQKLSNIFKNLIKSV